MRKAAAADLTPLFRREFELCNLREGEVVALLTDATTWAEYVEASGGAAQSLGAQVFEVKVPLLGWDVPTPVKGMGASVPALAHESPLLEAVRAALTKASFVVDLVRETIIHVPLRDQLRNAGTRILTIVEPPDVLERMFPSPKIKESVEAITERIANARELRVTSDGGTDVVYELTPKTPFTQYGYADVPGRWDHWPSALAVAYPVDETAEGTVCLQPGDIVFPFKKYVESPVKLRLEKGYITSVEGGLDAQLVQGYLESWEEPEVFAASHIGFGLHPRAQWSALAFYEKDEVLGMDGRCFCGNFLFSTGPNRYTGRLVEAHLDIPMRGCNVWLDDEQLIATGKLLLGQTACRRAEVS
jgi:2,5-dihydroxypyridine 5,6-dioxygenase